MSLHPLSIPSPRCLHPWANTITTHWVLGNSFIASTFLQEAPILHVSSPGTKVSQCFMIVAWFIWQRWVIQAGMRPFWKLNCGKLFPSLSEISDKTWTRLRGSCLSRVAHPSDIQSQIHTFHFFFFKELTSVTTDAKKKARQVDNNTFVVNHSGFWLNFYRVWLTVIYMTFLGLFFPILMTDGQKHETVTWPSLRWQ